MPYYDQPLIIYEQPEIVIGPGNCVVEEPGVRLPRCFGRWVRQPNGSWCCVETIGV